MSSRIIYSRENRLRQIVQELLNLMEIRQDGEATLTLTGDTLPRLDVLESSLDIPVIEDSDRVRTLICHALKQTRKEGNPSFSLFKMQMESNVEQYLNSPLEDYAVVFFQNISFPRFENRAQGFNVIGTEIQTLGRHGTSDKYDLVAFKHAVDRRGPIYSRELDSSTFTPLVAVSKGVDGRDGFNRAIRAIDLLRGVFNFVGDLGSQWLFHTTPLGDYLPSPVYGLFDENGKFITVYSTSTHYDYVGQTLRQDILDEVRDLLSQLRQPEAGGDLMSVILDALQKYGQAMVAIEWGDAYLPFWQILESVTLQNENINMSEVAARTKTILGNDQLTADLIECAKDNRNRLVHLGAFSDSGLRQVIDLKLVVERMILFLLRPIVGIPTRRHLEWFYTYSTKGDADLERTIRNIMPESKALEEFLKTLLHSRRE